MSLFKTLRFVINHPLSRGREFEALSRYVRWQVGSRILRRTVECEWINGARFFARTGETGVTGNIYVGLHEFAEMGYLLHVLRPEDLFIDVGANAGSYAILASAAIGAASYAFEPVPKTHRRLVENVCLNDIEAKVEHPNIAIGEKPGRLLFTTAEETMNHALADGEHPKDTIEIEVSSLDVILRDESPSLIKIDVEGFETPVLLGAQDTLAKDSLHSVIVELNGSGDRYGFDEATIIEMMRDHGFSKYTYDPLCRRLLEPEIGSIGCDNAIFVKDEKWVNSRIAKAPMVEVNGCRF